MRDDEDWPDVLHEVEPQTDVDLIEHNAKLTKIFDATVSASLEAGVRVQLLMSELSLQRDDSGTATIYVFEGAVWSGACAEIEDIRTYRDADSHELMIVAVNKKIVWADLDLVHKRTRPEGGEQK